ncbi:MAG: aspartate dehydrogenase domain-containing protein [Pseudomonadota bacterium]
MNLLGAGTIENWDALTEAEVHFRGTAREAEIGYPKNATVAAAIALAGVGFEATQVELIADPHASANQHHLSVRGAFGSLTIEVSGEPLPSNPRSSVLAALSVIPALKERLPNY